MMTDYTTTKNYWDKVFEEEIPVSEVANPFPFQEIETGLHWVCSEAQHIVDFGCGNGKVLLRCLALGVENGLGIDISTKAISLASRTAHVSGLAGKATFVTGSTSRLRTLEDSSVDAMILFNIVDNMIPRDACALLDEVIRVTRHEGRVLLKLNDYFAESSLIESTEYETVSEGFYRETSGLFLWNLSNEDIESLLGPQLEVERSIRVEFKEQTIWNRLYFVRRRSNPLRQSTF